MAIKDFLECGKIVNIHGIKGEVKILPLCDTPDFLTEFDTFYTGSGEKLRVSSRVQKFSVITKIAGVDTPEAAAAWRGKKIYIKRSDAKLAPGEYFVSDLLGFAVKNAETGEEYGKLDDVLKTGANDVYQIKTPDGKLLLAPVIPDVVKKIDPDAETIEIIPLVGLFDD